MPESTPHKTTHSETTTQSPARPLDKKPLVGLFTEIFSTLRLTLILLLTLLIAALGIFIVARLIAGTLAWGFTTFALLFALATLLVLLVGYLAFLSVARPVLHLVRVSRAIAEGDLSQDIDIPRDGQLGPLARPLHKMTRHLQQQALALQQEAARMKAILSSIADGVIVRDTTGKVILMNDAARAMLADVPDPERHLFAKLKTPAGGEGEGSSRAHRVDLEDRIMSIRTAPVHAEDKTVLGDVLIMRDVTSQVAAERLKDDFINSISHELRTPLTVIKGYSDILKHGPQKVPPAVHSQALNAIFSQAESLERMISQVIDLSEMASGTLYLDRCPTNLNQLVKQALEEWDDAFREVELMPHLQNAWEALIIDGDRRRLRWVLDAILQNACQHSPQGGKLEINLARVESTAVIQIGDEGVGISAEDLPHIFKRFYRGRALGVDSSVPDPRGLGQGLYIVKSIVEAHEGRVWAESKVGKGSKFSILLPINGEEDAP